MLEAQSEASCIDLYYGDETQVSETGYVPYGWQFADESVSIAVSRGRLMNYFGLLSRSNQLLYKASEQTITSSFVLEQLDAFSLELVRPTVVVLDNARTHSAHKIKERLACWQARGLYVFYLPPHLNLIERLWKELKQRWLRASDYLSADQLFYVAEFALSAVGQELTNSFSSSKI